MPSQATTLAAEAHADGTSLQGRKGVSWSAIFQHLAPAALPQNPHLGA